MGFLDYDVEIRKIICSTNAIESLNAHYRRTVRRPPRRPTGQKLALGRTHAHTVVVTVHVAGRTITVDFPDGAQRTLTRTTTQPIRSYKAQRARTTHTDDQPATGT